jgi:ribosome recycling factor
MLIDKNKIQEEINAVITYMVQELKKFKTGRASVEVIESITVEAYGMTNKLNGVAQVQVEDATNVKVIVWDKTIFPAVEKALRESGIGASVGIDKDFIRLKFNPITEEDRKERVKELNKFLEEIRIRIRQVRQKYKKELDSMDKVSEDELKREEESLQKAVDEAIKQVEEMVNKKEKELMTV